MPSSKQDHVLVLAGGKGTRMGGPKVLMQIQDTPWWRIQSGRLALTKIEQTWVVSPESRGTIEPEQDAPSRLIDAAPVEPMFGSLMLGIRSLDLARIRGVFILPIDVPAPSPPVWRALAATARCAVPSYRDKCGHPIYLPSDWINKHLLADAADAPTRLDVLVRRDRTEVPVDDPDATTNLNTPEDVEAWIARN